MYALLREKHGVIATINKMSGLLVSSAAGHTTWVTQTDVCAKGFPSGSFSLLFGASLCHACYAFLRFYLPVMLILYYRKSLLYGGGCALQASGICGITPCSS